MKLRLVATRTVRVTVKTVMRLIAERRKKLTDPESQKNAEEALTKLKPFL